MQNVQIFGIKGSSASRAAERFFKERRIPMQYFDLNTRPMAAGELRRFTDRYSLAGLLDTAGAAYTNAGLGYMKLSDSQWLERIAGEPKLLRLPLVRCGNRVAAGPDEAAWKEIAAALSSKP